MSIDMAQMLWWLMDKEIILNLLWHWCFLYQWMESDLLLVSRWSSDKTHVTHMTAELFLLSVQIRLSRLIKEIKKRKRKKWRVGRPEAMYDTGGDNLYIKTGSKSSLCTRDSPRKSKRWLTLLKNEKYTMVLPLYYLSGQTSKLNLKLPA